MENKFIPLSVPNLKGNEAKYVLQAIESEWVSTGGAFITEFENHISKYVNSTGAVACQNGTAGLHVAMLASGITSDDLIIVPTLTFIAAINPVKYIGANPIFMDCDESLCMDPDKLLKFCNTECNFESERLVEKESNKHVKAILIVHVFGNMADMEKIMEIARQFNLIVIEDATEALGTFYNEGIYKGKFAGTIGDVGVYSFNGNKIITTGGGGMIVSNDKKLLSKAKHLTTQAKSDELYFTHDEIGYNYRMTNVQAAIGLAQLEKLEEFIKIKKFNYELYTEKIKDIDGLDLIDFREGIRPNYWFYSLIINEQYPLNRDEVIGLLSKQNVQARPVWGLISDQIPYLNSRTYELVRSKHYVNWIVNLPCSTNLDEKDVLFVVKCLHLES